MLEFLGKLFNREKRDAKPDGLTQAQREALIDLLVLAEFEDCFIAEAEANFVRTQIGSHPWETKQTIEGFYDASVTRTRSAAISDAARAEYLDEIVKRLDSPAARQRAWTLCKQLMQVDSEIAAPERTFLDALQSKLKL